MEGRFTPSYVRQRESSEAKVPPAAPSNYESGTHVRNLCLVWPDGNRKFYNYAYLVAGEFLPTENVIRLIFTSETVVLEGNCLLPLFTELLDHLPKIITCTKDRYAALADEDVPFVTKISIEANAQKNSR